MRTRNQTDLLGEPGPGVSGPGGDPPGTTPEEYASTEPDEEPPHESSLTGVAMEALRSGRYPEAPPDEKIPGEDAKLQAGDPDIDPLENEYSGDQIPPSTNSTPDQNGVDDIGRAYGIAEQDAGELVLGQEPIDKREVKRAELEPTGRRRRRRRSQAPRV